MKMDTPDKHIQKHGAKFIESIIGNEVAPVRGLALTRKRPRRLKDRLLGGWKAHEESNILDIPGLVRNQYEQHYLDRRSISVTLVFGSHEPIPSVCWTITGTGPDPGHVTWS